MKQHILNECPLYVWQFITRLVDRVCTVLVEYMAVQVTEKVTYKIFNNI
jgi:hypothetical protein